MKTVEGVRAQLQSTFDHLEGQGLTPVYVLVRIPELNQFAAVSGGLPLHRSALMDLKNYCNAELQKMDKPNG